MDDILLNTTACGLSVTFVVGAVLAVGLWLTASGCPAAPPPPCTKGGVDDPDPDPDPESEPSAIDAIALKYRTATSHRDLGAKCLERFILDADHEDINCIIGALTNAACSADARMDAVWALTNMLSSTTRATDHMADTYPELAVALMACARATADEKLRLQCIWALSNLAGDARPKHRDLLVGLGFAGLVSGLLKTAPADLDHEETYAWALGNVCRGAYNVNLQYASLTRIICQRLADASCHGGLVSIHTIEQIADAYLFTLCELLGACTAADADAAADCIGLVMCSKLPAHVCKTHLARPALVKNAVKFLGIVAAEAPGGGRLLFDAGFLDVAPGSNAAAPDILAPATLCTWLVTLHRIMVEVGVGPLVAAKVFKAVKDMCNGTINDGVAHECDALMLQALAQATRPADAQHLMAAGALKCVRRHLHDDAADGLALLARTALAAAGDTLDKAA